MLDFKNICLYLLISLICSCKVEKENDIIRVSRSDFPMKVKLDGDEILKDDYFHHHKLYILDTLLITTSNSGDYHYHAYHTNTLEYLGSVGVRGEGPDEWTMPYTTDGQYETDNSGIHLWIFDYLRGHISQINLTRTLNSGSPYPQYDERIQINGKEFPFFRLFYVNDSLLIGDSWMLEQNKARIKSYNPLNGDVRRSSLFPSMKNLKELPAEIINSLYTTSFVKHPSKNLFVQAMFVFNRIDIFNEDLDLISTIVDGENWEDNYYDAKDIDPSSNFLTEKVNGFDGLAVTNDFIFALEIRIKDSDNPSNRLDSFVRVYNWEGNAVCLLQFENELSSIAIDENAGMFYATDYKNEKVLRYDINRIINQWRD